MGLTLITGSPGVGKSAVCALLRRRGFRAIDADDDGLSRWFDRATGRDVVDPPAPVPAGWLDHFGWRIDRAALGDLATTAQESEVFVCGSAENEDEVWDLFDLTICLVADDETLRRRLGTRTSNSFGRHPEELAAVFRWNADNDQRYRERGARIVDAARPLDLVLHDVL